MNSGTYTSFQDYRRKSRRRSVGELFFVEDVLGSGEVAYASMFSIWTVGMTLPGGGAGGPLAYAGGLSALVGLIGLLALVRLKQEAAATETA